MVWRSVFVAFAISLCTVGLPSPGRTQQIQSGGDESAVQQSPTAFFAKQAPLTEANVVDQVLPSVVQVLAGDNTGTGVGVAGGIITNEHVVRGMSRVEIRTQDGNRAAAFASRSDFGFDLALLLTEATVPQLGLEPADAQRQGDPVFVIAYPRPDVFSGGASVSRGVLSAWRQDEAGVKYVQTDAAVNPGASGGAVVTLRGTLIGIVAGRIRASEGLGIAIASESISAFLAGGSTDVVASPSTDSAQQPSVDPTTREAVRAAILEYDLLETQAGLLLDAQILRPRATANWLARKTRDYAEARSAGVYIDQRLLDADFRAFRSPSRGQVDVDLIETWTAQHRDRNTNRVVRDFGVHRVPQTVTLLLTDGVWKIDDDRFYADGSQPF